MRVQTNLTPEIINKSLNLLTEIQQKLIKAFYGIGQPKIHNIVDLAKISDLPVYDTEKELINAINLIEKN